LSEGLLIGLIVASPTAQAAEPPYYWNIEKLVVAKCATIELTDNAGKPIATISKERLLILNEIRKRIEASSGIKVDLYIITGEKPNAFASNVMTGRNIMAINIPMLEELADDTDAFAALIGHEFAHIEQNHIRQKMEAANKIRLAANVVGLILSIGGIPLTPVIADVGGELAVSGYSRNQEEEADNIGFGFMKKAGFNPFGAVRLFTKMSEKADTGITFLSTHPSNEARVNEMRELIAKDVSGSVIEAEKAVTKVEVAFNRECESEKSPVTGAYSAIVFDSEERVPTLHQKIKCGLPDGSGIFTTRVDCVQREGTPLKK